MRFNELTIEAYSTGTTRVGDPGGEIRLPDDLEFATGYPAGLYLDAKGFYTRKIVHHWLLKGAQRMVIRNHQKIVYEGEIDNMDQALDQGAQGIHLHAVGYWGTILMNRNIRKNWVDTRITDNVWIQELDGTNVVGPAHASVNRSDNRILITPNTTESWADSDYIRLVYTMPYGQTIKRVTCDYGFSEGGQTWAMGMNTGGTNHWTVDADGTGSQDVTLGTPQNSFYFWFGNTSGGNQTAASGVFGRISNVKVYSELGNIRLDTIAGDFPTLISRISSSTARIQAASNPLDLIPFLADRWELAADILAKAAAAGDADFNPWAVGLLHSESVKAPDGKPVIYVEQQPDLDDYDLAISLGDENLVAPFKIVPDISGIKNNIVMEYYDDRGFANYLTPDDPSYSALRDQPSIDAYGRRDEKVSMGTSTATVAYNFGRRYLARKKDPIYKLITPLSLQGYIRKKDGGILPSSEITSGLRVKVENYHGGMIFLISATRYHHRDQICRCTSGEMPDLIMPRPVAPIPGPDPQPEAPTAAPTAAPASTGSGGGWKYRTWKRKGKKLGYSWAAWSKMRRWQILAIIGS